ncbi:MAG: RNA polymerase sigma-70 factor (ECF subfamily) [Pseudohongiellaceae bacterium]|jgi:RNA polymerase sigma-70 factor (ECF subfamily)
MDDSTTNDEALMLSYGNGDASSFDVLYQRHKAPLYRYFVRQVANQDLAHDLYQECWSKIINAADSYTHKSKWTTWAYRIAHNLVIDHYRVLKPVETEQDIETNAHDPDRVHDQDILAKQLKYCMGNLPAVQREVFILSQETDFTLKMISTVVGASHEAIKTRLRYARSALQDCLLKFGIHPSGRKDSSEIRT